DWLLVHNPDIRAAQIRALTDSSLNEYQIEEYVRQWVLRELIATYEYPSDWLGERIVVEESVQMGSTSKQADISIKNERRRTFIHVETKNASVSTFEFEAAERQLESYLSSTHTATVGMITNARITKVILKKIDPNDFDIIPDIPEYDIKGIHQRIKLVRE